MIVAGEQGRELVAAQAEHRAVGEDPADHAAGFLQIDIAELVAVFVVDDLEIVAVEHDEAEDRLFVRLRFPDGFVHAGGGDIEGRLVLDPGQGVGVSLAVQVADIQLHMVPHLQEGAGQLADLVVPVIVQLHVVFPGGNMLGGPGQLAERLGQAGNDQGGKHGKGRHDAHGDEDDTGHDLPPGSVDFAVRGHDDQLHAVGQGGIGELSVRAGGIPEGDEIAAGIFPFEELLLFRRDKVPQVLADLLIGMGQHGAVLRQDAGVAGVVDPDRADLLLHNLKEDIHAQHADELVGLVDGGHIGYGQGIVQAMGLVGSHPGGAAPADGRIVPDVMFSILRIQVPGVHGRLFHEAGLPEPGPEEAVLLFADVRGDAVVIGHNAAGMVGDGGKGLPHIVAVAGQVCIHAGGLAPGAGFPGGGTRHTAFHQRDRIQQVGGEMGHHFHGLADAGQVFVQLLLYVPGDQVQFLRGAAAALVPDGHIGDRSRSKHAGQDGCHRDCDNPRSDRMHASVSSVRPAGVFYFRVIFLKAGWVEPFQAVSKWPTRSEVT